MRNLFRAFVCIWVALPTTIWADAQAFFGVKMTVEAETVQGAEIVASVRPYTPEYTEIHGTSDGNLETVRLEVPQGSAIMLRDRTRLANGAFVGEAMASPIGLANFGVFPTLSITFKNWGGATATVALTIQTGGDLAAKVDGSNQMDRATAYSRVSLENRTAGVDIVNNRIDARADTASPEAKASADFSKRHLFRLRPGQEVAFEIAMTHFAIASSGDVDSLFPDEDG